MHAPGGGGDVVVGSARGGYSMRSQNGPSSTGGSIGGVGLADTGSGGRRSSQAQTSQGSPGPLSAEARRDSMKLAATAESVSTILPTRFEMQASQGETASLGLGLGLGRQMAPSPGVQQFGEDDVSLPSIFPSQKTRFSRGGDTSGKKMWRRKHASADHLAAGK